MLPLLRNASCVEEMMGEALAELHHHGSQLEAMLLEGRYCYVQLLSFPCNLDATQTRSCVQADGWLHLGSSHVCVGHRMGDERATLVAHVLH
jgi:hypothetical protein